MTQSQVQELRYLNGEASSPVARGRGNMSVRNSAPVGGDFPGPRGRGSMMRCVVIGVSSYLESCFHVLRILYIVTRHAMPFVGVESHRTSCHVIASIDHHMSPNHLCDINVAFVLPPMHVYCLMS